MGRPPFERGRTDLADRRMSRSHFCAQRSMSRDRPSTAQPTGMADAVAEPGEKQTTKTLVTSLRILRGAANASDEGARRFEASDARRCREGADSIASHHTQQRNREVGTRTASVLWAFRSRPKLEGRFGASA